MKTHARAVVIGGGIVGCSVAYHLTSAGWRDLVVIEQRQLSSGSTWHAAGLCLQMNLSAAMTTIQRASNELYQSLERAGRPTGLKLVGSLRLVGTDERLEEMQVRLGRARAWNLPFDVLAPRSARRLWSIMRVDDLLAVEWWPTDGYVDPSSATHALATAAQDLGAEIIHHARVVGIDRTKSGEWEVRTEKGSIRSEVVVNATGQWAREVCELVGFRLPILPLEHQYVVTEPIADLVERSAELPVMREPDGRYYVRQEGAGLLVGGYEAHPRAWRIDGIPPHFGGELLPPDLDRITDVLAAAGHRIPVFETAGIRTVVNGPDGYTPDHRFLMGEVPGRRGFFVLAGFNSLGIVGGGGAGRFLAEWIVDGEPSVDLTEFDVRRVFPFASVSSYMSETVTDGYARNFLIHYPDEELEAGRPLRTSPIYHRLGSLGARFGARSGWERALWYEPPHGTPNGRPSFRRPTSFLVVAHECRAVRDGVGLIEQGLAKFEVSGPGARAFLERVCANLVPSLGRVRYTPVLTPTGGFASEFTVAQVEPDRFYVVTSGSSEIRDGDWLARWCPDDGSVAVETVSATYGVLGVAGPRSRELLERCSLDDFSDAVFPFFGVREVSIGLAEVRVLRLSYTGVSGWELHVRAEYLCHVFDRLLDAGQDLGLVLFGYHALESLRLEAGFLAWGHELTPRTTPLEAGLTSFVAFDKGPFVGVTPCSGRERLVPHVSSCDSRSLIVRLCRLARSRSTGKAQPSGV